MFSNVNFRLNSAHAFLDFSKRWAYVPNGFSHTSLHEFSQGRSKQSQVGGSRHSEIESESSQSRPIEEPLVPDKGNKTKPASGSNFATVILTICILILLVFWIVFIVKYKKAKGKRP